MIGNRSIAITLLAVSLFSVSCSSKRIRKEEAPNTESTDPMRFSAANINEQETGTKASALAQGFLVSCWKAFGISGRHHVVMDRYEVIYENDSWSNTSKWSYVSDGYKDFYKEQFERYWDYSNFPYRFYAISPCPPHGQISSFVLNESELKIPADVVYSFQTAENGMVSGGAEPYMPSQVSRETSGRDFDLIVKDRDGNDKEINLGSRTLNRSVAMPFHHLTSKVRFGFYCQDLGTVDPSSDVSVFDVKIDVASDGFTTAAGGYSADLTNGSMVSGDFLDRTTKSHTQVPSLVRMDRAFAVDNKIKDHLSRATAYWSGCEDGLLQIPQQGVQIRVSFKVNGKMADENIVNAYNGMITYDEVQNITSYSDILLTPKMDDGTVVNKFDWEENTIYTYYIILSRFSMLPIEFTATLAPWEEVGGSLDTDLEK